MCFKLYNPIDFKYTSIVDWYGFCLYVQISSIVGTHFLSKNAFLSEWLSYTTYLLLRIELSTIQNTPSK